jgi:hypothetical protein
MPYGDNTKVIDNLLQLQRPLAEKRGLLTVLVLAGETIQADMVLDGIKALLEEAKTKRWLLDQNQGELEGGWSSCFSPIGRTPRLTVSNCLNPTRGNRAGCVAFCQLWAMHLS